MHWAICSMEVQVVGVWVFLSLFLRRDMETK